MVAISSFVQAKWFGANRDTSKIRLIVIHDMEAPESGQTAENVANYFKNGSGGRKASAHYNIDNNSIVQSVRDDVVAYHAPGGNSDGIGIEHAGYMRQTREEWLDEYSTSVLDLSARLAADLAIKYNIPAKRLSDAELKAGNRGFVGHDQISRVYKRSSHTDPGPNFPWDVYINKVAYYISTGGNDLIPSKPPVVQPEKPIDNSSDKFVYINEWNIPRKRRNLTIGDYGKEVYKLQMFLAALNYNGLDNKVIEVNGVYGPNTGFAIGYLQLQNKEQDNWIAEYPDKFPKRLAEFLITKLLATKNTLAFGLTSPEVYYWQCFLRLFSLSIKADWVFGKDTLRWTRQFQRDNAIEPTGVIDAKTIKRACEVIVLKYIEDLE